MGRGERSESFESVVGPSLHLKLGILFTMNFCISIPEVFGVLLCFLPEESASLA